MDESKVNISFRSSALIVEYSLQLKRKWIAVSVSRPNLHIGSTTSNPCLNLCSFKWLKFNLGSVNSLRPLLWCTVKMESSLGLLKLRIIHLNFQEWHFDKQKLLSTSFKFSKKDTQLCWYKTKLRFSSLSFQTSLCFTFAAKQNL